jgi:hypothetical protein
VRPVADEQTLEALIQNRFELMAGYAKGMRRAFNDELDSLKARSADMNVVIRAAQSWLHRDAEKIPTAVLPQLAVARAASPVLDKMVVMREELRQMWLNRSQYPRATHARVAKPGASAPKPVALLPCRVFNAIARGAGPEANLVAGSRFRVAGAANPTKKPASMRAFFWVETELLLQLHFLVVHMLASFWIKFLDQHFLGHGLLVLAGGVEVTSAGCDSSLIFSRPPLVAMMFPYVVY